MVFGIIAHFRSIRTGFVIPWLCNSAPSSDRYCSISCDCIPDYLLRAYYSMSCFRREDRPTRLYEEAVADILWWLPQRFYVMEYEMLTINKIFGSMSTRSVTP